VKKHSGMRPHDIVVLMKIAAKGDEPWYMKDLSIELGISASEISESLNRSSIAGLISVDKKHLMKHSLMDFLEFGLRYVYPQSPGGKVRGIVTSHSAPPLSHRMMSDENYVWPYAKGNSRGASIEPLHPKVPQACLIDPVFHEFMALCDALRVGRSRERDLASSELKKRLNIGK